MVTTVSESSPGLTLPSSLAPLRLMLADTPSPRGLDVSPKAVGSLFEGFGPRVTVRPYLVGYCRWDGRSGQRSSCRTIIPATSRRNLVTIVAQRRNGGQAALVKLQWTAEYSPKPGNPGIAKKMVLIEAWS